MEQLGTCQNCKKNKQYLERFWDIYKEIYNKKKEPTNDKKDQASSSTKSNKLFKFLGILEELKTPKETILLDDKELEIIIEYYDVRFHSDYIKLDDLLKKLDKASQIKLLLNNSDNSIAQNYELIINLLSTGYIKNLDSYYKNLIKFLLKNTLQDKDYDIIFNYFKDQGIDEYILQLHCKKNTKQTIDYINNMDIDTNCLNFILQNFQEKDYNGIKNNKPKKIYKINIAIADKTADYREAFFKAFINQLETPNTNQSESSKDAIKGKYNYVFGHYLGDQTQYSKSQYIISDNNAVNDLINLSKLRLKAKTDDNIKCFFNNNPSFIDSYCRDILLNIRVRSEETNILDLFSYCLKQIQTDETNKELGSMLLETYYELINKYET